jgi:hypothetical protein
MREGSRYVCSSVAVGLRVLVSKEGEGERRREQRKGSTSNEELVIMTIVQTINQVSGRTRLTSDADIS